MTYNNTFEDKSSLLKYWFPIINQYFKKEKVWMTFKKWGSNILKEYLKQATYLVVTSQWRHLTWKSQVLFQIVENAFARPKPIEKTKRREKKEMISPHHTVKVKTLWEGHKIWKNLPPVLTKQLFLLSSDKTSGR